MVPDEDRDATPGDSIYQHRQFVYLWIAQAISQVAQNAVNFAVLVLVQERTNSAMQTAVAVLSFTVPGVVFGILAGVVVDRAEKRTVLFVTNVARGAVVLAYLLFDQDVRMIYLVTIVFSTIGQFFAPAEAAAIPMLLPRRLLMSANSVFNLTFNGAQLVGMVILAPIIIKFVGVTALFPIIAVLYVVASAMVARLPADKDAPQAEDARQAAHQIAAKATGPAPTGRTRQALATIWNDILEGWRILTADLTSSMALAHLTLASIMMPLVAVVGPSFVVNVLRMRAEDMAFVFLPAGIGMVLGTLWVPRLARRISKLALVNYGMLLMGVSIIGAAGAKVGGSYLYYNILGGLVDLRNWPIGFDLLAIIMILFFVMGIGFGLLMVPAQTTLQERCPPSFRGRIFAVQFTLSSAASIPVLVSVGSVADIIGINKTIAAVGMAILAMMVLTIRFTPPELRSKTPQDYHSA